MRKPNEIVNLIRKPGRWRWVALAVAVVVGLGFLLRGTTKTNGDGATFPVRRGPLDITVLEGGSVQALESQEIKCEVRVGYQGLKILKIVEEGYAVTEDDVRTNKVLVELDSSDLQKQIVQQDIQFESAASSLIDAQQNFEIQLNQNLSDIKAAEQKARFARMDFDKFLGDNVTQEIVDRLGLEKELAAEQTNALSKSTAVKASMPNQSKSVVGSSSNSAAMAASSSVSNASTRPNLASSAPATAPLSVPVATNARPSVVIDFSEYAHIEALGDGEAKQKLRKFEDDLQVAKKELGQAQATLEGTRRLFAKGFVTKIDQERDEIAFENSRLKVQTAQTASDLFLKYDFAKSAEEFLSKYAEAVRELVRARKAAVSKLAQAEAKLKSAQGQYNIQTRQRKDLYEQVEKCVLTAKKTGLVVYGANRDDMVFYGGEERIREGATVRERQAIITIPDMTMMSIRVKIHESYIKKVKKGQKTRITVDAFPDKVLDGEVTKVGVLPDSQNRWMNPDMKVYLTTITIAGTHDWLKPGMSAKVEVIVDRLQDVTYVPIQAVTPMDGKRSCLVANGGTPDRRLVEVGQFNDEFIEIKNGLKEGERVLLRPAEAPSSEKADEEKAPSPTEKKKPELRPVAPAAGPAPGAAKRG